MASTRKLYSFPVLHETVWQADVRQFPVPGFDLDESDVRLIPSICLVCDSRLGSALEPGVVAPDVSPGEALLKHLSKAAMSHPSQGLPGILQLCRMEIAQAITPNLEKLGIKVEVVDSLDLVDEMERELRQLASDKIGPPDSLIDRYLPVEVVSAMNAAAVEFEKREFWKELHDDDLIEVLSPAAPHRGMRCVSILGAAGQEYGLGFFADEAAIKQMYNALPEKAKLPPEAFSLLFNSLDDLPAADRDYLRKHNLPFSPRLGVPLLWHSRNKSKVDPTAEEMVYVEGLCRALAQTSLEEFDSGEWVKTVATTRGDVTYSLRVPSLVRFHQGVAEPLRPLRPGSRVMDYQSLVMSRLIRSQHFATAQEVNDFMKRTVVGKSLDEWRPPPANASEQAEDLAYQALDASSRVASLMIKKALSLDPDCAPALLLLAEQATSPADRMNYLRQAVSAGERSLAKLGAFEDDDFPFWSDASTRPYMRAMFDLAHELARNGEGEQSVPYYRKLLELNPGDNQGVRYEFSRVLLSLGRLDELDKLLQSPDYEGEDSAEWMFVRALLEFRRQSPAAGQVLRQAMQSNRHLPAYLLGEKELPSVNPSFYEPGSDDEAVLVASDLLPVWAETPGALSWLAEVRKLRKLKPGPAGKARSKRHH